AVAKAPVQEAKEQIPPQPKMQPKAETENPKAKNTVLYPGKKTQEVKTQEVVVEEVVKEEESAEWAAGLGEEVCVGFSGGEMEVEAEELIVEEATEANYKEVKTTEVKTTVAEPVKTVPAKTAPAKQASTADPVKETAPIAKPTRHIVKQGESLWAIS